MTATDANAHATAHALPADKTTPFWTGAGALVTLWLAAVITFGLPGLYIPALMLVPVMMTLIVVYAWG